jgi:thioredoxin reductase (NADPH)
MFDSSLVDAAEPEQHSYDYDLIVIGGGSGGLACSKEAALLGKKVAVLDFVKPTPKGTAWGLGGTCVNVGCIPKKLMHTAALFGEAIQHDAAHYGWQIPQDQVKHSWSKMVDAVQDYIGSLNWGYKNELRDKKVEYLNAYGTFVDPHRLEVTFRDKTVKTISARRFVVATGGRPRYPGIPGDREFGITSDDLFSLSEPPGRTLVVGASYVALECAGFLKGLGFDTSLMARSIFLRGFDQQIAEMIGAYMASPAGVKIIRPAIPTRVEKAESGKLKVFYKQDESKEEKVDEYDTVVWAIGRNPETTKIGLDKVGVALNKDTGKIVAQQERTSIPHIYAIGDVLHGRPELTPVAILAGKLLARRLYGGSKIHMDYDTIPTTVFTPLEYGAIGLPEEDARKQYGDADIEVFHSYFKPLEHNLAEREGNTCYGKLVVRKSDDRVVGFHYLGPNAGEVTQGYALGMRMGAKKSDFDLTVGIHPTASEEMLYFNITKSSGVSPLKKGC